MKSYLCIGGPTHGKIVAIPEYSHDYIVMSYNQPYIGIIETLDYASCPEPRRERYVLKSLDIGEVSTEERNNVTVRVRLDVKVRVLVHDSILTAEEAMAYYRKLREGDVYDAILFATRKLELGRKGKARPPVL